MGRVKRPKNSVFRNIIEQQYDESVKYKLYRSVKGSKDWVQRLGLLKNLPVHNGCVNCICWNEKGDRLLSGSDDQHLIVSNPYNYKVLTDYRSSHKANIFSAKFLPCTNDTGIVSCSGDGMILYSDLLRLNETHNNVFNCHVGTTYEVATIPNDPYTFLSCGEDYTVRCFDLRTKEKCIKARCMEVCQTDIIISCQRAVTALTVNAAFPHQLAIGCSDSTVRIYDRRMLAPMSVNPKPLMSYIAPGMEGRSFRITSLSFSPRGEDILVSYSSEHLYLFGLKHGETMTLETESLVEEPMSVDADSPIAPVRRLRLRGDWSDTGPDARPQNYLPPGGSGASQARPTLHGTLMQRMTDVLSRMLNDPATRAALSHGGEAFPESDQSSHSEPPAHAGSEGEEGEEDVTTGEVIEEVSNPHPLDLPLPSFSSSFSQPQQEVQVETMEIEEHVVACREDEAEQENKEETPSPSTSSAPVEKPSTSNAQDSNISHLNELSTMYHGFVEKHGVEPMVNLMYSDVGSTASCISVFVGKEMSRQTSEEQNKTPEEQPEAAPSSETPVVNESTSQDNHSPIENHFTQPQDDDPGLPRIDSVRGNVSFSDSDDDLSPVLAAECRLVHPIEKHMDDAIKNARNESLEEKEEPSTKTRKSYFKQKYVGHRNARTMIKEATFWGDDYVISGSDCGHVFMWERQEGRLEMLLQADQHVVNCVQPHPYLPLLATSGIDYDVKLWAPIHSEPTFDQEVAEELMKRNAVMLEETKDTITVPASFMIRMLACLNQIRRGGRGRQQRRESNTNSD